jgi:hypothetical protein
MCSLESLQAVNRNTLRQLEPPASLLAQGRHRATCCCTGATRVICSRESLQVIRNTLETPASLLAPGRYAQPAPVLEGQGLSAHLSHFNVNPNTLRLNWRHQRSLTSGSQTSACCCSVIHLSSHFFCQKLHIFIFCHRLTIKFNSGEPKLTIQLGIPACMLDLQSWSK